MRQALLEATPVPADALVPTAPESCVEPSTGRIRTAAQVLRKLCDEHKLRADKNILKCPERQEFADHFLMSECATVSPEEGFVCWAHLLKAYEMSETAMREFALLAARGPEGQAEASKILHNLMRHTGIFNTDPTGWLRGSISNSNNYFIEWRTCEGSRPAPRNFQDLRVPEPESELPRGPSQWAGGPSGGSGTRDAWSSYRPQGKW